MNRTKSTLLAAADYIERHGWRQGRQSFVRGEPACMMVALGFATNAAGTHVDPTDEGSAEFRAARDVLYRVVRPAGGLLSVWNDATERTVAEVLAALRGAAAEVSR